MVLWFSDVRPIKYYTSRFIIQIIKSVAHSRDKRVNREEDRCRDVGIEELLTRN